MLISVYKRGAHRFAVPLALLVVFLTAPFAGYSRAPSSRNEPSTLTNKIIERIAAGEKQYMQNLRKYSPRVETYLQYDIPSTTVGDKVTHDAYFLGRLKFGPEPMEVSFTSGGLVDWMRNGLRSITLPFASPRLIPSRFATAAIIDDHGLDARRYVFDPVGWEYLGDVRCLAVDLHPRNKVGGAFEGRIWVEDRNYAIVRANGVRISPSWNTFYTHFDAWRENLQPNQWLPVYIYSEETDVAKAIRFKSNTRFWGYDLSVPHQQEEWSRIMIEAPEAVRDSTSTAETSPVEGKRQLELEAEQNVLWRLEKARLIAPPGPVDKVMETVLNNLVVTNHLDNLPPLHCRVLLTAPLESFTLRYTVVVSRGLLDVLPDEPALAMILAHELAHVVLGHRIDTKYAFNDRMLIPDEQLLARFDLSRGKDEEAAADAKALAILANSPYKNQLGNAGLFLRAAESAAPRLPHLFGAHLGNRLVAGPHAIRMAALMGGAPDLRPAKLDQIAALPLGSRVQVNAWDGTVSFPQRKNVALVDPSEKMPFEVSPQFPHLIRYEELGTKMAARRPGAP